MLDYEIQEMPLDGPPSPFRFYVHKKIDGVVVSTIPPDPMNRDYQEFLEWNTAREVPLSLPE